MGKGHLSTTSEKSGTKDKTITGIITIFPGGGRKKGRSLKKETRDRDVKEGFRSAGKGKERKTNQDAGPFVMVRRGNENRRTGKGLCRARTTGVVKNSLRTVGSMGKKKKFPGGRQTHREIFVFLAVLKQGGGGGGNKEEKKCWGGSETRQ